MFSFELKTVDKLRNKEKKLMDSFYLFEKEASLYKINLILILHRLG